MKPAIGLFMVGTFEPIRFGHLRPTSDILCEPHFAGALIP